MVSELTDNRPAISWVGNPIPQNVPRIRVLCDNHEHFLYIGRLENSTKRLDVLLHGLSRLDFEWSLDIFGDGPDRQLLVQLSRELGIHDRVTWHGWVDGPWAQLETASCLLLTSDFEGSPMVLMEAMACGLPVISSDCPTGPKDIVENGVNGFLFRKGDPSDLHRRLTDFHSLPRTQREQMSVAAQQSMRKFDVGSVVARMYEGLERFWNNTGVNCHDH